MKLSASTTQPFTDFIDTVSLQWQWLEEAYLVLISVPCLLSSPRIPTFAISTKVHTIGQKITSALVQELAFKVHQSGRLYEDIV